jgi:ribonuclease HI
MRPGLVATVAIDGGARGNPGPAGCGFVLEIRDGGREEHAIYLGETTNNVAEYAALLGALARALELGVVDIQVKSDSELLVRQLTGRYKVRAPHLQKLHLRAKALVGRFGHFSVVHVRREGNTAADRLANQAMDTRQSTVPCPEGMPPR